MVESNKYGIYVHCNIEINNDIWEMYVLPQAEYGEQCKYAFVRGCFSVSSFLIKNIT